MSDSARVEDLLVAPPPGGPRESGRALADRGYPAFIARRFVLARGQGFLSLISLLSALGFTVGVAALVIALALMTGFQDHVIQRILGANAHLIVFPAGGTRAIEAPDVVRRKLASVAGIAASEPIVQGYGGVIAPSGSIQWASVSGIDPRLDQRATSIASKVTEGALADLALPGSSGRPTILLGAEMARRLGVHRGDLIRLLIPRPRLSPWGVSVRQPPFEVAGTFETGFHDYDLGWAFINIETARELFDAGPGGAHWIAARVENLTQLRDVEARLRGALGDGYLVDDILRQNQPYFAALRVEKLVMFIVIGLIVIVAAMGVISTLVLTVSQKVREIGVLAALGATPRGIQRIFLMQGLSMGVLGTLCGAALGVGVAWACNRYHLIALDPEVYYLDYLPFIVRTADLSTVVGVALIVAVAASVFPARRASRLDPVEALRHD